MLWMIVSAIIILWLYGLVSSFHHWRFHPHTFSKRPGDYPDYDFSRVENPHDNL